VEGHSVHVLLKVCAKCIQGQDEAAKRRIGGEIEPEDERSDPRPWSRNGRGD
jgi:hypothetical protein